VAKALATAGLPVQRRILNVTVRRLPAAYPIYRRGYDEHFASVDAWVDSLDSVLSFGRHGLYAHDITHHEYRQVFARHVVDWTRLPNERAD
jgi:protoporphyrinogen oxidase